jgi:hypothetical protein
LSAVSALRFLALLAVVFTSRAEACSCMIQKGTRAEQVLEALNDAGVVFVARLRSSKLTPDKRYPEMTREDAQFVVIEVIRGPLFLGQPILVQQDIGSGACARSSTNDPVWMEDIVKPANGDNPPASEPTKFSKEWLIYSNGPGPYELSQCSRTAPLDVGGNEDLKILREFVKHPPKRPP